MKIAIMAAWNTTSGVAMHAEPVAKAFIDMGHKIQIFTFNKDDWHGEGLTAKDENYVTRCFGTGQKTNALDPRPFLENNFDILLVEDLGMLPADKLANIWPVLRKKAKLIHAVHENRICKHSWFYKLDWDKVVYFDQRQDFLKEIYPDAEYIPFPCFPIRKGDKKEARKRLGLPLNKKIIYSFGHRGYHSYLRSLPERLRKTSLLLLLIERDYQMLEELSSTPWRKVVKADFLTTKEFDDYLFASDAMILHKFMSREHAVVSSTVYQALGAGCPLFVPSQSDFFHDWKNEVVHYKDLTALNRKLVDVLYDKKKIKRLKDNANNFVKNHSPELVAEKLLNLFERTLRGE